MYTRRMPHVCINTYVFSTVTDLRKRCWGFLWSKARATSMSITCLSWKKIHASYVHIWNLRTLGFRHVNFRLLWTHHRWKRGNGRKLQCPIHLFEFCASTGIRLKRLVLSCRTFYQFGHRPHRVVVSVLNHLQKTSWNP